MPFTMRNLNNETRRSPWGVETFTLYLSVAKPVKFPSVLISEFLENKIMDLKAHLRQECWKVAMFFLCPSFVHHVAPLIILFEYRNAENCLLLLSTSIKRTRHSLGRRSGEGQTTPSLLCFAFLSLEFRCILEDSCAVLQQDQYLQSISSTPTSSPDLFFIPIKE